MSSLSNRSTARLVAACVLVPPVLIAPYVLLSRAAFRPDPSGAADWLALGVSLAAGLPFLVAIRLRPVPRVIALSAYLALGAVALFFLTFWLVGLVFGDWL